MINKFLYIYSFTEDHQDLEKISKIIAYSMEGDTILFGKSIFLLTNARPELVQYSRTKMFFENGINNSSFMLSNISNYSAGDISAFVLNTMIKKSEKGIHYFKSKNKKEEPKLIISSKLDTINGFYLEEEDYDNIFIYRDISAVDIIKVVNGLEISESKKEVYDLPTIDDILDKINSSNNRLDAIKELSEIELKILKSNDK